MKTQTLKKAKKVIELAELVSIRLLRGSMKTKLRSAHEAGEVVYFLDFKGRLAERQAGRFYTHTDFKIEVLAVGEDQEERKAPLVDVKARFELEYELSEEEDVSKQELTAFSKINAVFNTWPYFREFTQSSFRRMELPGVVLPLFKLRDLMPSNEAASGTPES